MPWWPVPKARPASISTRDVVGLDLGAIVPAVDEEAAGADRGETGQGAGDPVALFREPEGRGRGGRFVGGGGDQRPDVVLVRRHAEIGLDQPRLAAAGPRVLGFESGRGGLGGFEALDDEIGDGAGAALVGHERQTMGGVVGREAFEHGAPPRKLRSGVRSSRDFEATFGSNGFTLIVPA